MLSKMVSNPELMVLMQNPKLQEIMKKVRSRVFLRFGMAAPVESLTKSYTTPHPSWLFLPHAWFLRQNGLLRSSTGNLSSASLRVAGALAFELRRHVCLARPYLAACLRSHRLLYPSTRSWLVDPRRWRRCRKIRRRRSCCRSSRKPWGASCHRPLAR